MSRILAEEFLLITAPGIEAFKLRVAGGGEEQAKREAVFGQDLQGMEVDDGIARIPIVGVIGRGLDRYDKMFGAVDVADIEDDLDSAEQDPDVRAIMLYVDSPGGMVSGTPELADRILKCEKPIYTFTAGLTCSAMYWLASATDGIFATKSADIGSIGVYTSYADYSDYCKQMGIKVQVFSSGIYKGAGVPGTALTKEQKGMIQDRIMEIADMFYDHVRGTRGAIADEAMQGQTFKAAAAVDQGLIDMVVTNEQEARQLIIG